MSHDIATIRTFNRTVAQCLGMLNQQYLGRDRPYVESRIIFEIGFKGATVRDLRERLGLDSGFLSRLLRKLERKGLALTKKPSTSDRRVRHVRLTRAGKAELGWLNNASDRLAESMWAPLTESQRERFLSAVTDVEKLLRASSVEFVPEDASSAEATWCLNNYFAELDVRFRNGFDPGKGNASDGNEYDPPHGLFLVARLFGKPVGCGALRKLEPGVGEIKRMWISPEARGLGIGRRLLAELECAAKRHRLRRVRLDTNATLKVALQLYRSNGYHEIPRFNENPYAQRWFEKRL